jgi:ketosteroid isomerase-like protein
VFLVVPARAGVDPDKSPEDVFKSFAAAVKKNDMKAMMSHLTSDSQAATAGIMAFAAAFDEVFYGL